MYNEQTSGKIKTFFCFFKNMFEQSVCLFLEFAVSLHPKIRPRSLVNRTTDSGSVGHRFESCRGHRLKINKIAALDIF